MTWKEFKEKLEEEGIKDDDKIWYIDVTFPTGEFLEITRQEKQERNLGFSVYN